jgi:biotin carboxyl carrier protein
MASIDLETVRHSLTVARKNGFAEVELVSGEDHFHATLEPLPRTAAAASESSKAPVVTPIVAPLVGYYRPGPVDLSVGATIAIGDVVAIIGALGIANEVESKVAGEVTEVLVIPGDPVQFNQVLAMVKS